jgi:hypothetical protein
LTLAVRIAVSFSLLTGPTKSAVVIVADGNRATLRGSKTNINLPVPSIICTYIVHAIETRLTVIVGITVTLTVTTGTTDQAIICCTQQLCTLLVHQANVSL